MTTIEAKAFLRGFVYGRLHGYTTRRIAEEMYPEYSRDSIRLFMNGNDDGARGDKFRATLVTQQGVRL